MSGPTQMDYVSAAEARWQAHPRLALVLRVCIALLPVLLSVTLSLTAAHYYPPYRLGLNKWLWWVLVGGLSTVVLLGSDRVVRRLLPLTALLKMTLIFPDNAPSRFRLAMRTGTTKQLEKLVEKSRMDGVVTTEIDRASTMLELVAALSVHDHLTRGHCERVRAYTDLVVEEMHLPESEANLLRWSALLHDVGKLRVPRAILTSDKRPTDEEWNLLTTHPAEGMALTECLADWLGEWRRAIGEHHERCDGKGYPGGLRGEEIHLGARIVAVADAYDVMTSVRSYKKPISAASAREEIARCSAGQFDPVVVRAFLNIGLRRLQFALGPLAWLSNLPFIGQAPIITAATNAIGGVATATVLTAATFGTAPVSAQAPNRPPAVYADVTAGGGTHTTTTVRTDVDDFPSIDGYTVGRGQTEDAEPLTTRVDAAVLVTTTIAAAATGTTAPSPTTTAARPTPTVAPLSPSATTRPPVTTASPTASAAPATNAAPADTAAPVTTAAPAATDPPTTAATTTTAPGATVQALYFTPSGTGDRIFSTNQPASVGATEPDVDGDGKPGLTLRKGAVRSIAWSGPLTLGSHLHGQVMLDLFSGVNNFNTGEQQTMSADLQICDALGLNCTSILSNTWTHKPWAVGGSNTWTERQLVLGVVDVTVPLTGKLRLVVTAIERDMQLAMSGERPSSLQVTLGG